MNRIRSTTVLVAIALIVSCDASTGEGASGYARTKPTSSGIRPANGQAILPPFFVATTGSDTMGNGSINRPWATPQHALDQIKARGLNQNMTADVVVELRAGTWQRQALALDETYLTGSNGHAIVLDSYDGMLAARLLGGYIVNTASCTAVSGSIVRCPIDGGLTPHLLCEDGLTLDIARTPNKVYTPEYPAASGPFFLAQPAIVNSHLQFAYLSTDVDLSAINVADVTVVDRPMFKGTSFGWPWTIIPAAAFDLTNHVVTLSEQTSYFTYSAVANGGMPYYLEGSCSWLDQAGEWCQETGGAPFIRIWPTAPIGSTEIIIPTTMDVIRAVGSDGSHIADRLTTRGLDIQVSDAPDRFVGGPWGSDIPYPPNPGGPDWDPAQFAPLGPYPLSQPGPSYLWHAGVFAQNAAHITFDHTRIHNTGLAGFYALGPNTGHLIEDSGIDNTGYDSIYLHGGYPKAGDVNNSTTVTRTIMKLGGRVVPFGRCLEVIASGSNMFTSSACMQMPREGVSSGGLCDVSPPDSAFCYNKNNLYTHMTFTDLNNQAMDSGAIYESTLMILSGSSAPFTTNFFDQNLIARNTSNQYSELWNRRLNGVYFDIDADHQSVTNTMVEASSVSSLCQFNSGSHTQTNDSFAADCSGPNGSFDSSLIDNANIGVDWAHHPMAAIETDTMSDDFETGMSRWCTASTKLLPTTSCIPVGGLDTAISHSATHSFKPADGEQRYLTLPGAQHAIASFWLYDSGGSNDQCIGRADEPAWNQTQLSYFANQNALTSGWRGVGVDAVASSGFYVAFYGGVEHVTTKARSVGQHLCTLNYETGNSVTMSIDGTPVASGITGVWQFEILVLGDPFSDGHSGNCRLDDVSVTH